jgi:hypothetical protein
MLCFANKIAVFFLYFHSFFVFFFFLQLALLVMFGIYEFMDASPCMVLYGGLIFHISYT